MNNRILQILRNSVANAWKKKGCSCYRSLLIDDSKESEEAIQFMEDLGFAYRLEYLDLARERNEFRLPALRLSHSRIFQGLEEIKTYGRNLLVSPSRGDSVLTEVMGDTRRPSAGSDTVSARKVPPPLN